jgi:hypothetical protein
VGYQVRQSNRIASATALQSVLDGFANRSLTQYMEHPETMDTYLRDNPSAPSLIDLYPRAYAIDDDNMV